MAGVAFALALAIGWPAPAQAGGPAFDCGAAKGPAPGEVEQLICRDPALAALDRQLDAIYRSALARARDGMALQLRQEQRGWIQGRNDCWKARGQPTWITATWTVDTVPGCVEAQYRLRGAELQAVWRLLPPRTVAYTCQGQPANELVAHFFATDPPTIRLERGDRSSTLWRVGEPAAGRYEGQNVGAIHRGDGLALTRLDTDTGQTEQLRCQAK
jgi:uncharacterized protein YecT (DUF1311 family)